MEQFSAILLLFGFFFGGILLGFLRVIPKRFYPWVGRGIMVTLYLLLFSMGVRTALIDGIESKIGEIGFVSFIYALAAVLFSGGGVMLITLCRRRSGRLKSAMVRPSLGRLFREPLNMIAIVLCGFFIQRLTGWFSWIQEWTLFGQDSTTLVLFCMLLLVGLNLIIEDISILQSMKDKEVLLLPLFTVLFTLISGVVVNQLFNHSLQESLAISGGLGWYSFSGVYLAEVGTPILGSIAFLANLFREMLSVIMIPLLGSWGFAYGAISTAGATSMDVTLPIVEHSCGDRYTPVSLYHGVVVSIVVPLLVPLLYGM